MKADSNLAKTMRESKIPINEPKAVAEELMQAGTRLNEAKIAAPLKVKSKNPIKPALLPPHEIVNTRKSTRSVTFKDLNMGGNTDGKAGKGDDLNNDETIDTEGNEQSHNIKMTSAELAKAEMSKHLIRSRNSLKSALTKLEKEHSQNLKMQRY